MKQRGRDSGGKRRAGVKQRGGGGEGKTRVDVRKRGRGRGRGIVMKRLIDWERKRGGDMNRGEIERERERERERDVGKKQK